MAIRFFLEYQNLVVQLPVNPEALAVKIEGSNKTTEVISLGEINLLRQSKLAALTIESFLPQNADAPYVVTSGEFKLPQFYLNFFNKVRDDKKPCRLIITDTPVNFLVSIESLQYGLKGGDDDIYYSLELREYRTYGAKKITITEPTTETGVVTSPPRPPVGFAVGDLVTVDGKGYYTSYGASPTTTFNSYAGKISIIVASTTRPYRYHITSPTGSMRGWVAKSQLKHR